MLCNKYKDFISMFKFPRLFSVLTQGVNWLPISGAKLMEACRLEVTKNTDIQTPHRRTRVLILLSMSVTSFRPARVHRGSSGSPRVSHTHETPFVKKNPLCPRLRMALFFFRVEDHKAINSIDEVVPGVIGA
jgi:hypothetical protein